MAAHAEKLAEIDEELARFGKSDDELAEVTARAVALAATLAGDESLGELLEGREQARAAALRAARDALPPRPEPSKTTVVGNPSDAAPASEPAPVLGPPRASEPVLGPPRASEPVFDPPRASEPVLGPPRASEPVLGPPRASEPVFDPPRASEPALEPPPVLEPPPALDPPPASEPPPALDLDADSTAPPEDRDAGAPRPGDHEAEFGGDASSDIAGMSVDELFADAEPVASAAPSADFSGLFADEPEPEPQRLSAVDISDLFEDSDDAMRLSAPDLSLESLEDPPSEEGDRMSTEPPPADAPPPAFEVGPAFGDDVEESTMNIGLDDLELAGGDDFELLVDEEVLDFGDEAAADAESAGAPEDQGKEERKGGLISRILGRK